MDTRMLQLKNLKFHIEYKKPGPNGLGFLIYPVKVTTRKLDYFSFDFVNHFNNSDTAKLTVAPMTAKIIVFTISAERILGKTLNRVPAAVPLFREILASIACIIFGLRQILGCVFNSYLTNCR